jgi:hypothetical protein
MIELPHKTTATKGGLRNMIEILKSMVGHAAFLPVLSALLTLIITNVFDLKKRQALEKQIFFDRFFPERIKAYNDLFEKMPEIIKALAGIPHQDPSSRPDALLKIVNKMNTEFFMKNLWLGQEVLDLLVKAIDVIRLPLYREDEITMVESIDDENLNSIMSSFMILIGLLNKQIEFSSGIKLLDNKFYQITKPSFWQRIVSFVKRDDKKAEKTMERIFSYKWKFFNAKEGI